MHLNISPQVREGEYLSLVKKGDALVINGETYDFSFLPEGAVLPSSAVDNFYVVGDVTRIGGRLFFSAILLPIQFDAPHEARFPTPIIDPPDGPIALPRTSGGEHED